MADQSGAGIAVQRRGNAALVGKAVTICFLTGICTAILAPGLPPVSLRWMALLAGVLLWLATPRWRWLGAMLAGLGWTCLHAGWGLDQQLATHWEAQEVTVTGVVSSLPQHEVRRTRFQLRLDAGADLPADLRGRVVQVAWYDDFGATEPGPRMQLHAGERWRMSLRLRAPRGLINPGGFDARDTPWRRALPPAESCANRLHRNGWLQPQALVHGASAWPRGSQHRFRPRPRAMCKPWRWAIRAVSAKATGRCCAQPA